MAKNDPSSSNEDFILPADWRGKVMTQIRTLVRQADPDIIEQVKYKTPSNPNGVLVWYHHGMIGTGEVYTKHLRIAFTKGPMLKEHDPNGLINTYRAMIIRSEDTIDESAFINLIQEAVRLNQSEPPKA